MMKNNKVAFAVISLMATLVSAQASAITLTGTNVSYTFDSAELGLFGSASLSGNSLVFSPTSFTATSALPAVQTINITVMANSGYQLTAFNVQEQGGYTGSAAAVYVSGNLGATDIEGDSSKYIGSALSSSLSGGTWTASAGVTVPTTTGWGGADGIVGSVSLTLSNQLFASGAGSIFKDFVSINTSTAVSPVPEASNYALMLVGLGLVGFMARRSRIVI